MLEDIKETQPPHEADEPADDKPSTSSTPSAPSRSALSSLPDLRETLSGEPDAADTAAAKSREEFTTVYDIIDHLEQILTDAKGSLFFPNQARVDRDEFAEQLTALKGMLPVQLERASALMREAERRLENAQSQSSAIVASAQSRAADMIKEAQDQAQFLAGQENVTDLARQQARSILDQAQSKSERLTQGADEYCTKVMQGLQEQLDKLSVDVRAGLDVLNARKAEASEQREQSAQHHENASGGEHQ